MNCYPCYFVGKEKDTDISYFNVEPTPIRVFNPQKAANEDTYHVPQK